MYLEESMKHMMFVFCADTPTPDLHTQIAELTGVELVYELTGHHAHGSEHPDLVVIITDDAHAVQEAIEAFSPGVRTYVQLVWKEQPHIITSADIPGGPVTAPAKLMVAPAPIITSDDIPGFVPNPAMRPALVHRDFSSQAGLASFDGMGIGGIDQLVELHH